MNAVLTKKELKEKLKGYRNILVCGPQRSGTTFAGFAIAEMLGIKYYTEEAFGVHDEQLFFKLLKTNGPKVIQCPALSHILDQIEPKDLLLIIWMVRPVKDIINSQNRIQWNEESIEKAKYIKRVNDLWQKGKLKDIKFHLPISKIKYLFWQNYQKAIISNFIEINYNDLSNIFTDKWIVTNDRKEFSSRQIDNAETSGYLSGHVLTCQLFFDFGSGFKEEDSIVEAIQMGENRVTFNLQTSKNDRSITALRFDPADMPIVINLDSFKLSPSSNGIFIESENSTYQLKNKFYFNHNDPQFVIKSHEKKSITAKKISFQFNVEEIGINAIQKLYKDQINSLNQKVKQDEKINDIIKQNILKEKSQLIEQLHSYQSARDIALAVIEEKNSILKKLESNIEKIKVVNQAEILSLTQNFQVETNGLLLNNKKLNTEIENIKSLHEAEIISINLKFTSEINEVLSKNQHLEKKIFQSELEKEKLSLAIREVESNLQNAENNNVKISLNLKEKDAKIETLDRLNLSQERKILTLQKELELEKCKNTRLDKIVQELTERSATLDAELKENMGKFDLIKKQLAETREANTNLAGEIEYKNELIETHQIKLETIAQRQKEVYEHNERIRKENLDLKNSFSFRIGWMITGPFRWVYEMFRFNKLPLWINLTIIGLRKPIALISKLKVEHFRILKKALKNESPSQIIRNFKSFISGEVSSEVLLETQKSTSSKPKKLTSSNQSFESNQFPKALNQTKLSSFIEDITKFQNPGPDFLPELKKELELGPNPILKLIAFYLPQFHCIPENDLAWGKGFTEWTNVTKGIPRFSGHYQPRLPADFGFYNLSQKETIAKQVELAKKAGLFGFCFHYYWFSGNRLLEKPLDLFLEDKSIDFNFCICWANENWTKRWDGMDQDVIIKQDFSPEDTTTFIEDLKPYLRDDRYIYLNGRPLIIVYRPQLIPDLNEIVATWRKMLIEDGFGDPILCAAQAFGLQSPQEVGFDSVVEFPPHKLAENKKNRRDEYIIYDKHYQGHIIDYDDIVDAAISEPPPAYDLFRGVFPSWDNEARKKGKGATYHGSTPKKFEEWLHFASEYALRNPINDNSLVFINAWNEWAEGAYLEPDQHYGYRYLNVVQGISEQFNLNKDKYIVVSHDAHLHGAQLNVLSLAKTLKRQFGLEITIILLDSGALEPKFHEVARTINVNEYLPFNRPGLLNLFKTLKQEGYNYAILNTTVSNNLLPEISQLNIHSLSLVHELPNLIKEYKLEEEVRSIAENADHVVFASHIVENGFRSFQPQINGEVIIRPQGVYAFDLFSTDKIKAGKLREKLGLKPDAIIVGSLGFADMRKGIDLFIQIADYVSQRDTNCHFVWVGNIHEVIEPWIRHDIEKLIQKGHVHLVPFHDKISEYIKDINIFALTSREDPFPSVVLEALAMGAMCVVFKGSGGIVELNDQFPDLLTIVPYLDTEAMGKAILDIARDPKRRGKLSQYGKETMRNHFSYDDYCFFLTQRFDPNLRKVTVIVPNYNYAHTLEDRLRSIWDQDYPIFELIILDDCSTDNSLDKIEKLVEKFKRKVRVIENKSNSGSPFLQWQKGIEIARGDLIWIAEADDMAEPGFLSAMIPFFKDEQVGLAYSQSKQIDENGHHLANNYLYYTDDLDKNKWRNNYLINGKHEIIEGLAVKNTILNVSSVVWRLDLIKQVMNEHIDEVRNFKVAGDWYLYIKALEQARIGFCAQSLNIHRRHSSSVTHKLNIDRHLQEIKIIQQMVQDLDSFPIELMTKQNSYFSSVKEILEKR